MVKGTQTEARAPRNAALSQRHWGEKVRLLAPLPAYPPAPDQKGLSKGYGRLAAAVCDWFRSIFPIARTLSCSLLDHWTSRNKGGQSTTKRTVSAPVRQLSFYFIPPPPCTSDASRPKGISTGSTASQGSDLSHTEGRPACCTLSRTISIGVRMCEHLRV